MITASSFTLTIQKFLASPGPLSNIAGFASLNYRLSTPPPLPQFAEFMEPENPARNVKHPAHLNDVIAAFSYPQRTYEFGNNYILVGLAVALLLLFKFPMEVGLYLQLACWVWRGSIISGD
jgi:hypothetical protein